MKRTLSISSLMAGFLVLVAVGTAPASIITIGDNDGYGYGIADGATLPTSGEIHNWVFDNRSEEVGATDGAQVTDFEPYAARDFSFSLSFEPMTDGVMKFWMDYSGLQATVFGQPLLRLNGVDFSSALNFQQGAWGSDVAEIFLDPNLTGLADGVLNVEFRGGQYDHIAFDYFALEMIPNGDNLGEIPGGAIPGGETPAPVPEPSSLILIGSGLIGLAYVRRRFSL